MASGAMNYIGSISILERAAAPAQAVLDRNARTRAQRQAEETKEELTKVMDRVENIYGNFELEDIIFENKYSGMEVVEDLDTLEGILQDQVKKKKYQQQITIFVVGVQNASDQKLRLLNQVNEFFVENTKKMEEEEEERSTPSKSPERNMDNVKETIEDTLRTTEDLMLRLGELHQEIINYMYNYVQARTNNKNHMDVLLKGKKKMEKSVAQSKDDINHLTEKLLILQKDIEDRDEKIQHLMKQVEMRNLYLNKYKSAVESAKSDNDVDKLQEEVKQRDETIQGLQRQLDNLQIELGTKENSAKMANSRVTDAQQKANMKVEQLQKALEERNIEMEEAKRRLQRQFDGHMDDLKEDHRMQVDDLQKQHADELKKLMEALDIMKTRLGEESQSSRRYLEDEKKETAAKRGGQANKKPDPKKAQNKLQKKPSQKDNKEFADPQDEDDSADRSNAEHVPPPEKMPENFNKEFDNEFGLDDEISWASVPPEDVYGRFVQFRRMAREVIADLSEQLDETVRRSTRKIDVVKEQFQDHKSRWEEEKETLLKQLSEAQQLRHVAEEETNQAIAQMEGYIEQEDILDEEEESKTRSLADKEVQTNERPSSRKTPNPELEAEIQSKLFEMTDDAKVLSRQKSKDSSGKEESTGDVESSASVDVVDIGTSPLPEKKRSVTFSASLSKISDWLDPEEKEIIESIKKMLSSKEDFTDAQQSALEMLRGEILTDDMVRESGPLLVYSLSCHLAHQSVMMGIDPSSLLRTLAHFTAMSFDKEDYITFIIPETPKLSRKDLRLLKSYSLTPQISEVELKESIKGETVDEVRESSAKSRRSIRDQHRNSLASLKAETEGRQSRSTGSANSSKSLVNKDEVTVGQLEKNDIQDTATSPMTDNMLETENPQSMATHPLMESFLHTYNGIATFKENLSQVFMDKEMTSASQELNEVAMMKFDKDEDVQPQMEQMISSAYQVFEKCVNLLDTLLGEEREDYNVSTVSANPEQSTVQETEDSVTTSQSERESSDTLRRELQGQLQNLQEQYVMLQRQFDENSKKYEGQMQRKTKSMMEMQDTINNLKQEVANLKKQLLAKPEPTNMMDSPLMFTRMDSERNAKILKRAVNEKRIPHEKYVEAVESMDSYIGLPAKRFAHLVRKYLHHRNMKNIEKNLQKSRHLANPLVVNTLEKMEATDSRREKKWAGQMDKMSAERLQLATSLMSTLDDIEQESGIFLIKPFYSYKGSTVGHQKSQGKLSRRPPLQEHPPVITPASHVRTVQQLQNPGRSASRQNESQSVFTARSSNIDSLQNYPVWMPNESQMFDNVSSGIEVPKIMELDVNRMLIAQNQISMKVVPSAVTNDRLTNAANASVRSYIAVMRPTRLPEFPQHPVQTETRDVKTPSAIREASTVSNSNKLSREVKGPPSLPSLPPIAQSTYPDRGNEAPLPPASPPGSSIRRTPSARHSAKFSLPSEPDRP